MNTTFICENIAWTDKNNISGPLPVTKFSEIFYCTKSSELLAYTSHSGEKKAFVPLDPDLDATVKYLRCNEPYLYKHHVYIRTLAYKRDVS